MAIVFGNFDVSDFWDTEIYNDEDHVEPPPSDETVAAVEEALGYRLPKSYVELSRVRNGGAPRNTCHRTKRPTSWAKDHVSISSILAIGKTADMSLLGGTGSRFMIEEWGYPPIGVYFADCPSAGHDMLCLDYRRRWLNSEPRVVHVDQEIGYKITFVAPSFEAFIRGLQPDEAFDTDE
jgi:hypothetical protein